MDFTSIKVNLGRGKVFIGSTGIKCLMKVIFESVDNDFLGLYRRYLSSLFSATAAFKKAKFLSDAQLAKLYNLDRPDREPKYLNLIGKWCRDLPRLEAVLKSNIVLLRWKGSDAETMEESLARAKSRGFYKIYDRINYHYSLENTDGSFVLRMPASPVLCFVLVADQGFFDVYACNKHWSLFYYSPLECELSPNQTRLGVPFSGCYLSDIGWLLTGRVVTEHECLLMCRSLVHLEASIEEDVILEFTRGTSFALGIHTMSPIRMRSDNCAILSELHRNIKITAVYGIKSSEETCPVIMLTSRRVPDVEESTVRVIPWLYKLDDVAASKASSNFIKKNCSFSINVPKKNKKEEMEGKLTGGCQCTGCLTAHEVEDNVPKFGAQSLFTHDPSIYDLLKMCGMDNEETRKAVFEASNLSMSAFDIETISVPERDPFDADVSIPEVGVSFTKTERIVTSRHEAIRLGYIDWLMMTKGERNPIILRRVNDEDVGKREDLGGDNSLIVNSIEFHHCIEEAFLNLLLSRRRLAQERKKSILAPVMEKVRQFKRRHYEFYISKAIFCPLLGAADVVDSFVDSDDDSDDYDDDDDDEENAMYSRERCSYCKGRELSEEELVDQKDANSGVAQSFEHSVLGKLERRLEYLETHFTCCAYNGSRFDNLLIAADMILSAMRMHLPYPVRIQRKACSIRSISIGKISIMDFKYLVPPSYSLSQLAKTCNLPIQKSHFPFGKLVNTQFLKLPKLPPDADSWKSNLNPQSNVTQDQVDEMLNFFESKSMTSINDFLEVHNHQSNFFLRFSSNILFTVLSRAGCGITNAEHGQIKRILF